MMLSFPDLSESTKTKGSAVTKSKYLITKSWSAATWVLHGCVISKRHKQQSYKIPSVLAHRYFLILVWDVQLYTKDRGTTETVWLYIFNCFIEKLKVLEIVYNTTPNNFHCPLDILS